MKKILLIIVLTLAIFQMVVLATAIDIGSAATDRATWASWGYTIINKTNPANLSGRITSVEIWAYADIVNCEVATFYEISPNVFSTRDVHTIGAVTSGSKQTFSGLDITVQAGDYIGIYYTEGSVDYDETGGSGRWRVAGDQIPCTDVDFGAPNDVYAYSLYGTGESGWPHKWNAITIVKWNTKEITKWNDLE